MPRNGPEFADWYHALSLRERLASRSRLPAEMEASGTVRKRLARWKAEPPFATTSLFAKRLAADQITESDLLTLLAEPSESLRQRTPCPDWAARVEQAFAEPRIGETIPWPEEFRTAQSLGFLESIQPLLQAALADLREGINGLVGKENAPPIDVAAAYTLFLPHLPGRLLTRLARTLVLEVNVARLQGDLVGDTAEERFASFVSKMCSPANMLALLREYPVLARELVRCLDQWVAASLEFLRQLGADWTSIRAAFSPAEDPGLLTELKGDAGDRHRQGRSVYLLRFASGFRLAYKPKSMAVDVHFQKLLDWIKERHQTTASDLRIPRVLDHGTYGWVEFVEALPCQTVEELGRFYQRQGALLALLYALAAIDFHHENLIASGEYPVPLDLEALFHPLGLEEDNQRADYLANVMLYNSVFGVGLLPGRIWSSPDSEGVDMSGLGGMPGQLFPFASPAWEGEGTDQLRLIRKRYIMPEAENRPTLKGEAVHPGPYTEDLIAGFRDMYRFLEARRSELLAARGPLSWFEDDEVRVVVRATRTYVELLRESFHPDVLRNGLDRDRLFDRLWNGADESPYLGKLIPAEQSDLWNCDVPMFTTRPPSRDLWTSTGERIPSVLGDPGMVRARRRLEAMSENDLTQQLWFIRASLATLSPARVRPLQPLYQLPEVAVKADRARFLAAARAVGDRLEKLAVRGEDDVSWIGLGLINERTWTLVPLGADFYDGVPGLAFFLAYLGAITGEVRYTSLARAALATVRSALRLRPNVLTSIGAFAGWGGLLYTWTHLGALWRDADLLAEAEGFIDRLPELIEKDETLDIIDGSAGCLLALLALDNHLPSRKALDAAVRCGERILAGAQPAGQGVGWKTAVPASAPVTGMSHGTAGIALALFRLGARTQDPRFRETAQKAIAYERGVFSAEKGNWPDFRIFPGETESGGRFEYLTAWCHGAVGIGLARLACLPYFEDGLVRGEIDTALERTRTEGFGWNHTLCHGDLGNLELLLQAGRVLADSQWESEATQVASAILAIIERDGWICANPVDVETPGLMTGIAGIGYALLRVAEPDRVPPILLLEPPQRILR